MLVGSCDLEFKLFSLYIFVGRAGIITPDTIMKALGVDIDRSALLKDVLSIKANFLDGTYQHYCPEDGINKA